MILSINTATRQFGLALLKGRGTILAELLLAPPLGNFKELMPAVTSLMGTSGSGVDDLEAIVVAIGPGSFTGLRVGLALGKGMAQALRIPIIGVPCLEAMARQVPFTGFPLCPMIESRKDEVFFTLFSWEERHRIVRIREDTCMKMDDLPSVIDRETIFLGNDFINQGRRIIEALGDRAIMAPPHLWNLKASSVGARGYARFVKGDFDDLHELVPLYMRSPHIRPSPRSVLPEGEVKQGEGAVRNPPSH